MTRAPAATLACLLLAVATPARAEWTKVGETARQAYYINAATIHKVDQMPRVWVVQDLKQPAATGAMSRRALQEFDCAAERVRILSISEHAGPMADGEVIFLDNAEREWRQAAPGTFNEVVRRIVCAR